MNHLFLLNIESNIAISNQLSKPISLNSRIELLKHLEHQIKRNRTKIQDALFTDLGKPAPETDLTEIIPITSELKHVAKNIPKWASDTRVKRSVLHFNSKASIMYRPKGCVLILSPWNYPFNLIMSPLIAAIAAGNRVVLKPSEFTPNVNRVIREITDAVFSSDRVMMIEGAADVAAKLTSMPFHHIFFTGSPQVGGKVMKAASDNLASVTLELGGKSPCIVHKDSNLKKAASRIIWGKFVNCGQTCIAPDYLLIHEDKAESFIQYAIDELRDRFPVAFKGKNGDESYGRIIHQKHLNHLKELLKDAIARGYELKTGGNFDDALLFMAPTILSGSLDEKVASITIEEIFGPILPIYTYSNEEQVFEYIGQKPRPLATYLFTESNTFINEFRNRIVTGGFVTNDVLSHFVHPHLPFGGVNNSGIGRSHGFYGFKEFSNETAVLKTGIGPSGAEILGTPYTNFKRKIIERALKFL